MKPGTVRAAVEFIARHTMSDKDARMHSMVDEYGIHWQQTIGPVLCGVVQRRAGIGASIARRLPVVTAQRLRAIIRKTLVA